MIHGDHPRMDEHSNPTRNHATEGQLRAAICAVLLVLLSITALADGQAPSARRGPITYVIPAARRADWYVRCARHGTDLGGASPLRADWPEPLANGNCCAAMRVGRKPAANLGADEQEPDTRPMWTDDPAADGELQQPNGSHSGRSGGARGKDQCLTLGDLFLPSGNRSRGAETPPDTGREVSRGHSSPDHRVKG
jgi:hypothetical protein